MGARLLCINWVEPELLDGRLDLGLGEVAGEGALRDRVARPAVDHAWHSRVGRR